MSPLTKMHLAGLAVFALGSLALSAAGPVKPDYHLEAVPENVVAGYFSAETPPVLKIKSGQIVEIDSVALMGLSEDHPEKFFIDNGISTELPSVKKLIALKKALKGTSSAPLTGPIYIEGAVPGDTLEVRVLDMKSYTPFGINVGTPGKGGIPDLVPRPYSKFIHFDLDRNIAKFAKNITVPLGQFQGMFAVAPTKDRGRLPSRPPYADIGGNFDNKHFGKGATVYIPVHVDGALFHVGDPHAAQGNGEVSQAAIESSNTVTLQIILRKDLHLKAVRAETPTHYIVIGVDEELSIAMRKAIVSTIDFLGETRGLDFFDALGLASIAVDYEVTQVVDGVKGIHGMIPKSLFKDIHTADYWYKEDVAVASVR